MPLKKNVIVKCFENAASRAYDHVIMMTNTEHITDDYFSFCDGL